MGKHYFGELYGPKVKKGLAAVAAGQIRVKGLPAQKAQAFLAGIERMPEEQWFKMVQGIYVKGKLIPKWEAMGIERVWNEIVKPCYERYKAWLASQGASSTEALSASRW